MDGGSIAPVANVGLHANKSLEAPDSSGSSDVDTSFMPLELAESLEALDTFGGSASGREVVTQPQHVSSPRSDLDDIHEELPASMEDSTSSGPLSRSVMDDSLPMSTPTKPHGTSIFDDSLYNDDDIDFDDEPSSSLRASPMSSRSDLLPRQSPKSAASESEAGVEAEADAEAEMTTPSLTPSSSTSPQTTKEKEPTSVFGSNDDSVDEGVDDMIIGFRHADESLSVSSGTEKASTATDDAIDVLNMNMNSPGAGSVGDDDEDEENYSNDRFAEVLDQEDVFPPMPKVGDLAIDEDGQNTERADTDNLSGISDPINELTETPLGSPQKEQIATHRGASGDDSEAEVGDEDSSGQEPLAVSRDDDGQMSETVESVDPPAQAGEGAAGKASNNNEGGDEHDDSSLASESEESDRPSSPASPNDPTAASEKTNVRDLNETVDEGRAMTRVTEMDVRKEKPSVRLARILLDESLVPVDIDAERICSEEDGDLNPHMQDPDLDGEPAYLYTKKEADKTAAVPRTTLTPSSLIAPATPSSVDDDVLSSNSTSDPTTDSSGKPPLPVQEQVEKSYSEDSNASAAKVSGEKTFPKEAAAAKDKASKSNADSVEKPSSQTEFNDLPPDASPLPNSTPILACGSIMTRSSLRSLVMKKWHLSYFVRYGPTSVLLFRTKDDFDDWLLNPYHSAKQREYLVKARLDFYSEMKKPDVRGFKMTDIKVKTYEKKGKPMHNFKLEKWTNMGVSLVAAFASPDIREVETVRDAVRHSLEMCPSKGLRSIDDLLVRTPSEKAKAAVAASRGGK